MRDFISSLLLIFILISCTPNSSSSEGPLHSVAPYPIGVAIGYKTLGNDTIMDIAGYEFNSLTAENSMKMYTILRDPSYDFSQPDAYIDYAEKENIRMFGHALLWHYGLPDHVKKLEDDSAALYKLTMDYIYKVVSRYKGKIDAWDVVNEAIADKTGEYRENIWYKTLGEAYIEMAFRTAHEADPRAKLFINDYNLERDPVKLKGLLNLVTRLKEKGVPIHGIGMQMHISMDTPVETISHHVQKCADTGLMIHFSELDIVFNKRGKAPKFTELTGEMGKDQAEKYKQIAEIYNMHVPREQQYGITLWGFSDRHTWIRGFYDMMDWPLIFDDDLRKKPAYHGLKEGLKSNN